MALYSISKAKDTSVGADHIASAHTFFGCLGIMINPLHPNVNPHLVKLQKESVKYTKHLFYKKASYPAQCIIEEHS